MTVRGLTSIQNEAATAARAFARPRGAGERSEHCVSEEMVAVRGATSNRNPRDGLAGGIAQGEMVEPRGIEPLTSTMPL